MEVELLNEDPTPIEQLTVPAIVEHLEGVLRELESPPILIGHSAGGAFVQILLDHGFGSAGVAINSAPTEGVPVVPLSQLKSTLPVFKNPANHHRAVGLTYKQWHYAFTSTFPEGHLMPPKVQRSDAGHDRSAAVTEVREYPGRAHLLPAQEGWEEVADTGLEWAVSHAVGEPAR